MKRRQLTPREQNAAKRLAEIWNKKKTELGLTQETAAHRCGWETQGAFYQYVAGKIPLNLEATLKIAEVLEVTPGEIFPELVQMIPRQLHANDTPGAYRTQKEVGALSKEEEMLVKKYRQLQSKERTQAQAVIDALASTKIPTKKRTVE